MDVIVTLLDDFLALVLTSESHSLLLFTIPFSEALRIG